MTASTKTACKTQLQAYFVYRCKFSEVFPPNSHDCTPAACTRHKRVKIITELKNVKIERSYFFIPDEELSLPSISSKYHVINKMSLETARKLNF
jgi:hypothetical protein